MNPDRLRRHIQGIEAFIQTAQNALNEARRELAELRVEAAADTTSHATGSHS